MSNNKQIIPKRGHHYWILKEGEQVPEIATYERSQNGVHFFHQMEMKHFPEAKSIDVPFTVLKEAVFDGNIEDF